MVYKSSSPDIITVLNTICILPASGAVVERGFSLTNFIVNNLQSLMNIKTLDATIRIHFYGIDFTDDEADKIINVRKRRGNLRNEL